MLLVIWFLVLLCWVFDVLFALGFKARNASKACEDIEFGSLKHKLVIVFQDISLSKSTNNLTLWEIIGMYISLLLLLLFTLFCLYIFVFWVCCFLKNNSFVFWFCYLFMFNTPFLFGYFFLIPFCFLVLLIFLYIPWNIHVTIFKNYQIELFGLTKE